MGLADSLPGTFVPRDEMGGLWTIDHVHRMIHAGLHFTASQYLSLPAASAMNVLITAPADANYHFTAEVETDAVATVTFCKTPNLTTTGASAITAYNNKEYSTNTNTLTLSYLNPYVSSGTVLTTYLMGSSSGQGANKATVGGSAGSREEVELEPSSVHLIRVVAGAATCQTVVRMYFYRED